MAPTTVHSRVAAFESLAAPADDLLGTPLPPIMSAPLQPVQAPPRPSPSPSPPNLGRRTSLIDLRDWVVDDGPAPPPLISFDASPKQNQKPVPRPKPPALVAPPRLPPRKPSTPAPVPVPASRRTDSLTVEHAQHPIAGHAPSSSVSSFHSVSLSEDYEPSTPGSVAGHIATFPIDTPRPQPPARPPAPDADAVSLSGSYEEVSASALASPNTERLINLAWERASTPRKPGPVPGPPRLPDRPTLRTQLRSPPPPAPYAPRVASGSASSPNSPVIRPTISAASSSSSIAPPYVPRRSAPPPPSRNSDRASIQSIATTSSSAQSHTHAAAAGPSLLSLKVKRPTPVPANARRRYDAVFTANVLQRRRAEQRAVQEKPPLLTPGEARGRRALGWRGLSVDLVTGDEIGAPQKDKQGSGGAVGPEERLEGGLVHLIWMRSGLDKGLLAEIWNECDPGGRGALSADAFARGMWRIDEELRRAQAHAVKTAASGGRYRPPPKSTSTTSSNRPSPKQHKPRDILR